MTAAGYLKRLSKRLTADLEELDAEQISEQSQATGATPSPRSQSVAEPGRAIAPPAARGFRDDPRPPVD